MAAARWGVPRLPDGATPFPPADEFGDTGPRLVIKTPVPAGRRGESWGDLQLVRGLARALARQGFRVRVDRWEARGRVSEGDAATLVLRGRSMPDWSGARPHMMWCISHPTEIGREEFSRFDRVFVASHLLAECWQKQIGPGRVIPLLQAFDGDGILDMPVDSRWGRYPVFIGNSRFVRRPVVEDGLVAGLPLLVVGLNWEGRIPGEMWRAPGLPNHQALAVYGAAGVVLNDHWPDMRRHGFLSNRLFDVVARGRLVVSDEVPTAREVFGEAVVSYRTPSELRRRVDASMGVRLPPSFVDEFRRAHGLDARAEVVAGALAELGVG